MNIDFKNTNIGQRISTLMANKGLSNADLSRLSSISESAIGNYIDKNRLPQTKELYKIAKALECSMEWLIDGIEETSTNLHNRGDSENEKEAIELLNKLDYRNQIKLLAFMEREVEDISAKLLKKDTQSSSFSTENRLNGTSNTYN